MSQITEDDVFQRQRAARLKIVEAKAQLWAIANFLVALGVVGGLVLLLALFFKIVLG